MKRKQIGPACNCIAKVNAKMKAKGIPAVIDVCMVLDFGRRQAADCMKIAVTRTDKKRKPINVVCAYCPVCGKKYKHDDGVP